MAGRFATTRWSVVLAAGSTGAESRHALETLCQTYWHQIYAFVRRSGYGPDRALDVTQDFFTGLIDRRDISRADPSRGRFRSWLIRAWKSRMANDRDYRTAQKRDERKVVWLDSLDAEERYRLEPRSELDPERAFDRDWALKLLQRCFDRIEAECAVQGKAALFAQLKTYLAHAPEPGDYAAIAAALGLKANNVKQQVSRWRKRWAELVHAETADLVERREDVPTELDYLLRALKPGNDHGRRALRHVR